MAVNLPPSIFYIFEFDLNTDGSNICITGTDRISLAGRRNVAYASGPYGTNLSAANCNANQSKKCAALWETDHPERQS